MNGQYKVQIFENESYYNLEKEIENYLNEKNREIVSISYSTDKYFAGYHFQTSYSALVITK